MGEQLNLIIERPALVLKLIFLGKLVVIFFKLPQHIFFAHFFKLFTENHRNRVNSSKPVLSF